MRTIRRKIIKIRTIGVYSHYAEPITLTQICNNKFFSVPYVSKKFKEEKGIAFAAYLQELRIYHACKLLVETDMKIEQISASVGYGNTAAFRRIFLKSIGQTPSDYRKLHKSNAQ